MTPPTTPWTIDETFPGLKLIAADVILDCEDARGIVVRLPVVIINYQDDRLREYRAVDNPHVRRPFGG